MSSAFITNDSEFGTLIVALKHPSSTVRRDAARCIGDFIERANQSLALEPLIRALNDKDTSVRRKVAVSFGAFAKNKATIPLIAGLAAIKDVAAIQPLADLIGDSNAYIRREVSMALGEINHPGNADILKKALEDKDAIVRFRAAESIRLLGF
jgi:HEAT repeat protein